MLWSDYSSLNLLNLWMKSYGVTIKRKLLSQNVCKPSTTYFLLLNKRKFIFLWLFLGGGPPTNWSVGATNLPRDKCLHCLWWKTFILHQMHQYLVTDSMRKCSQAVDGILVSRKTVTDMIDTQVFKTLNIPMENWLILLNYTTGTFNEVTKKSLSRNTIDTIFSWAVSALSGCNNKLRIPSGKCGSKKWQRAKNFSPQSQGLKKVRQSKTSKFPCWVLTKVTFKAHRQIIL